MKSKTFLHLLLKFMLNLIHFTCSKWSKLKLLY